jgi:hypothetical protein
MKMREDVANAYKAAHGLTGLGSSVKLLQQQLKTEEKTVSMTKASHGDYVGVLAVTNRRFIFAARFIATKKITDIPLQEITSVRGGRDLENSSLTVSVAGSTITFQALAWRDADNVTNLLRTMVEESHNNSQEGTADRLLKLKQLLDAGVLTQGEYEAKASVLKSAL